MKKEITLQLQCSDFPGRKFSGYGNVHLGVQKGNDILWDTPGDTISHQFDIPVYVEENRDGSPNFLGSFVHGKLGDRYLYLVWYNLKNGEKEMFRRAKVSLQHMTKDMVDAAFAHEKIIRAAISLSGKTGSPVCAMLKAENISWE